MKDLFKAIGIVFMFFLAFSPLFYCAEKLDQKTDQRARELGCADGQTAYLSPLSNQPHYELCEVKK